MSKYLLVNKEANEIESLLEVEGEYMINTLNMFSVLAHNDLVLDFSLNTYYYDTTLEGKIRKVPKEVVQESPQEGVYISD